MGLAASLPLLVGAALDWAHGWIPTGDQATIVLRARDVFSAHTPLLGQYSEISWYAGHAVYAPGPLLYWLLAVPASLCRWWPAAPLMWMALVQTAVVVCIVLLAQRAGGLGLAVLTAAGVVMLEWSVGPRILYDPWSAWAPILPLVLLVFLTWHLVDGRDRLLPLAALVASFEVQSDPSFTVVAGVLALVGLGASIVWWWRRRSANWGSLWLSLAVVVACWLPSLVQQATTSPGNFSLLWRGTRAQGGREGLAFGLTIVAKAVASWPFGRLTHVLLEPGSNVSRLWALCGALVLAVMLGLVLLAIRLGEKEVAAGSGVVLSLMVAVTIAAALMPNDAHARDASWTLEWTRAAGMLVWVVGAWAVLTMARLTSARLLRVGAALVAAGAVLVAVAGRTPDGNRWAYPVIRQAADMVDQKTGGDALSVGAAMWPPVPLVVGQGLIEELDARGRTVGAGGLFRPNLGRPRIPAGVPVAYVRLWGDPKPNGVTSAPLRAGQVVLRVPVDLYEYGRRVVVRVAILRVP